MTNKCEINVIDFIFNNHESIRKLNELVVNEKEIKDIELLEFINKKTMFIVISPENILFSKYDYIEKIFEFNGRTVNSYIAFAGTRCECLAVIDKNLEKDTIIPIYYDSLIALRAIPFYYDSLEALKASGGNIELAISHVKMFKLKV